MASNFPTTVTPSDARKISQPRVSGVAFGSGYSQRGLFGINQNLKTWNFTWQNISETNADEIETFLDARAGVEYFLFTPPGESSEGKYVCPSWNKSIPYINRATIIASFAEVAEP